MNKLVISFLIFILLLFTFFAQNLFAQSPSPTPVPYNLPYPGNILPDNPFYKLIVLRDKIILLITSDTNKKAEYHLLLADKKFQTAQILVNKGELALAKDTALKAENEITLLTFDYKNNNKKPTKQLFERLQLASKKHQEILIQIIIKVGNKDKDTFEKVIGFSITNSEEINKIYSE